MVDDSETVTGEQDSLVDFIAPRLRLFLAVDAVGSTALKQSERARRFRFKNKLQPWFLPLGDFLREFELYVYETWKHRETDPPQLWKFIGDELVFVKDLADLSEITPTLSGWVEAIEIFRKNRPLPSDNPDDSIYSSLDVRSGAWLAGFPFINTELAITTSAASGTRERREVNNGIPQPSKGPSAEATLEGYLFTDHYERLRRLLGGKGDPGLSLDFVGPSMDLGFRLVDLSEPHRMMISADLAYIVLAQDKQLQELCFQDATDASIKLPQHIEPAENGGDAHLPVSYGGTVGLKGILGGEPYPKLWIATLDPRPDRSEYIHQREKLSGNETDQLKILKLLHPFLRRTDIYQIVPYVADRTKNDDFARIPDDLSKLEGVRDDGAPWSHIAKISYLREKFHTEFIEGKGANAAEMMGATGGETAHEETQQRAQELIEKSRKQENK